MTPADALDPVGRTVDETLDSLRYDLRGDQMRSMVECDEAKLRAVLRRLEEDSRDAKRYRSVRLMALLGWEDADGSGMPEQVVFAGILAMGERAVAALHAAWSPEDSAFMADDDCGKMSPDAFDIAVDAAIQPVLDTPTGEDAAAAPRPDAGGAG